MPATEAQDRLEIAHVLFMDIVSYSLLPMDEQRDIIATLQGIVRDTPQFKQADQENEVIALPTGDGMALAFFGDPSRAAECALEIARILKKKPELRLRMGLHSGPVYRVADVNKNKNVAGGGINMAQRIMDAGDAGHILVSSEMASTLGQLSRWKPHLTDFGMHQVKHGVSLHFYNLCTGDAGLSTLPSKWKKQQAPTLRWVWVGAAVLLLAAAGTGLAIWNKRTPAASVNEISDTISEEFLNKRPQVAQGQPKPRFEYQLASDGKAASGKPKTAGERPLVLGVTLWRVNTTPKPGVPSGARLLVLEGQAAPAQESVPERVEANTILHEGDKVRLSIEVPSTGYLYVIDREQYADGTTSDPFLIYPNAQTRAGDNAVAPGRLLEIPDQRDDPNCFTVRSSRPGQTSELISLLLLPEPRPELKAGSTALHLNLKEVSDWEQSWGVTPQKFELRGGAGTGWSEKEKAAGSDHAVILTQDDSLPQTLYRVDMQPGSPMMLKVPLRLK